MRLFPRHPLLFMFNISHVGLCFESPPSKGDGIFATNPRRPCPSIFASNRESARCLPPTQHGTRKSKAHGYTNVRGQITPMHVSFTIVLPQHQTSPPPIPYRLNVYIDFPLSMSHLIMTHHKHHLHSLPSDY